MNTQRNIAVRACRRGLSRTVLLILLGVGVLLGGGGYAAIQILKASAPLQGETVHDFGVVPIEGRETSFTHTFRLTNATSESMYIADVRPSCGCAGATFSPKTVGPGEVLSIEARLTLSQSGYRDANVEILTAGEYTKRVYLKATGRRENPIWSPRAELLYGSTRGVLDLPLAAETYGRAEPPPVPSIVVPEQFKVANISEWRLVRPEKAGSDQGAQWSLSVRLDYNGLPVAEDSQAIASITYDGKPLEIRVPIVKRDI